MGARIAGTRVVGTSLVVLFWLGGSGGWAADALVGELGPIRQSVARRNDVRAQVLNGPLPLGNRPLRRNHATEGAIAGAVVGGVMGGLYFGAMGAWACQAHSDGCGTALLLAAGGAAGGALVGGMVGSLVGTLFQTGPSTRTEPSRNRTKVTILPGRRGMGAALVHSF